MGEKDSKKWVLMATARSPTNIAVIKYWGKRDETLILPVNGSISVTLDPSHLSATTTVAVSPSFDRDRMWLNGKEILLSGGRFQSCLREIRRRAEDVEDEERGICIKREDWEGLHVHIASFNNFPTAAGLASSAAGFACLVFALAKLMNVKEETTELSSIARQGSGSACRSLYGGFVKWAMGNKEDGSDSIAVQLANETHWEDLVILIAVVCSRQKETSSTTGMRESVETSSLLQYRSQVVVPRRLIQMEEAIQKRDFPSFAKLTCADSNQFHAVCLDTSPPIFYMNDTSHRHVQLCFLVYCICLFIRLLDYRNFQDRWNQFEGTPQVTYTYDAGPNAVLIAPNRKVAHLLLQRMLFYFPPPSEKELDSYVLGDTSILQEAGLHSKKDIEALLPPAEAKTNAPPQKYTGDINYFICTRPGSGPVLLSGDDQALLNAETGLPKLSADRP
ncbi:hypothetical protein QJS10_CPB13g01602 [Acorus calamus]|uniref:Diphosphomevalonate decarboxylase n=1 Tax=Acorus calamus TaxID=4465 RepID=A0AAV9DHA0_ACOCL|nr:hypothetical protein QJS10_CPB13g01602 [Acorus calamus]